MLEYMRTVCQNTLVKVDVEIKQFFPACFQDLSKQCFINKVASFERLSGKLKTKISNVVSFSATEKDSR